MFKIFRLFLISLILLTIVSCQETETASIAVVLNHIDLTFSEGDTISHVTTHVTLPLQSDRNKKAIITWESSHPEIIDSYGTVNQPRDNTDVILTVTVTLDEQTLVKYFNLTVIGYYQEVTVTFVVQDKTYETVYLNQGDTVLSIDDPVVEGFIFEGWYIAPTNEVKYELSMPVNESMTVEAKLTAIPEGEYKVETYYENIDDEAYQLIETTSHFDYIGTLISLNPELTGFTLNEELSITETTISETSSTLKLYYDRDTYTVTFVSDDIEIGTEEIKYGQTIFFPDDLTKENYVLSGWSKDIEGEDAFDENDIIDLDITLYAKWIYVNQTIDNFNFFGFDNYYQSLNSSSEVINDLARLLRSSINYVSYGDARYVYVKYDNDSQVILYDVATSPTYRKVPAYGTAGWGSAGVITTPDFKVTINREHVWACNDMKIMPITKARTLSKYVDFLLNDGSFDYRPSNTEKGHYTDLFNIWNSLATPNQVHSDHFYGEEDGKSQASYLKNNIFYPGDEYRGDIARILFYMTLMYPHLTLVEKGSPLANEGSIYYGYLDVLLRWNEEDPVSYYELERNETIFGKQKNRNPFIDFYDYDFAELLFAAGDPNVLN